MTWLFHINAMPLQLQCLFLMIPLWKVIGVDTFLVTPHSIIIQLHVIVQWLMALLDSVVIQATSKCRITLKICRNCLISLILIVVIRLTETIFSLKLNVGVLVLNNSLLLLKVITGSIIGLFPKHQDLVNALAKSTLFLKQLYKNILKLLKY